jgi:hypothetical protein
MENGREFVGLLLMRDTLLDQYQIQRKSWSLQLWSLTKKKQGIIVDKMQTKTRSSGKCNCLLSP